MCIIGLLIRYLFWFESKNLDSVSFELSVYSSAQTQIRIFCIINTKCQETQKIIKWIETTHKMIKTTSSKTSSNINITSPVSLKLDFDILYNKIDYALSPLSSTSSKRGVVFFTRVTIFLSPFLNSLMIWASDILLGFKTKLLLFLLWPRALCRSFVFVVLPLSLHHLRQRNGPY